MLDRKDAVAVIGGGPAGLTAALALAQAGVATVLIGRRAPGVDHRTTALLGSSVTALETLGVWRNCVEYAAPLKIMRIVDDTGRLLRAPEVKFDPAEIGLDTFGYNIENQHLLGALTHSARSLPTLRIVKAEVEGLECRDELVEIRLAGADSLKASLVIGADGRRSLCRAAAGIETHQRAYPQSALTMTFGHARPHHGISTEFHTASGPFTQVPLVGNRSSLVWVIDPADVNEIASRDDQTLAADIERRLHSILGKVWVEPGRGVFPLATVTARSYAENRIALVGEAAHVIPPIGAQGLNLGLRDAATIAELVAQAIRHNRDPGDANLLSRYDEMRRADLASRAAAVDLLNRSLLSDFLPLQGVRGLGVYALDRVGPLRRAAMREGTSPHAQPSLMRGHAI